MKCLAISYTALILLLSLIVAACATSPEGRSQLILLQDSDMEQLGVKSFNELKAQTKIERDPAINAYVKCIATAILHEAQGFENTASWEIVVFKDDQANAFALPGGKIGVYTGILKVAKTQDQLAAVLGHEVGHVVARHGNERMSQALATQGIISLAELGTADNSNQGLIMAALGVGAQYGVALPHSRTQEAEADIIGLGIMAHAGFNPQESVELWKNMMAATGGGPPEFLSTHPAPANRISNLQSHMAQAAVWSGEARVAGRVPSCRK